MTCPLCHQPTPITRKPTADERRALATLRQTVKIAVAAIHAEKRMAEGVPHLMLRASNEGGGW